jgi:glycine betaine/proline transport system substrate-binding protein
MRRAAALACLLLASWLLPAREAAAADIVIGVPNWPSVRVTAEVLARVIHEDLGLEVEIQAASNPVIFEAMARGSIDIHPEVWFPNQEKLYERYRDRLVVNAHHASGAQGVCVNGAATRAGFRDIADLTDPAKAALLDQDGDGRGDIFIGAPGWSSTQVERARAHAYGYEAMLDLRQVDEGLADTELAVASRRNRPWAGFCYAPHHRFILHPDLRMLKEPGHDATRWRATSPDDDPQWIAHSRVAMAWPAQSIQPVYARLLESRQPLVATLVRNMDLTAEEISAFAYQMVVARREPTEIAREWVTRHHARITGWLRG